MKLRKVFKRKVLVVSSLILGLALLLGGCARTSTTPLPQVKSINITYVKSPLNLPSIIEKDHKLFESEFNKDGIQVNFPEINSGAKQTEALAAGSLDICNALGSTSAILAAANGVDLKIISLYSRAPRAFMVVARSPEIDSITSLKGKKVAGPKGTILHQLLSAALLKNGMSPADIEFVNMDISAAAAALHSGKIDAALLAGADAQSALGAGARMLVNGDGLIQGTLVVAVRGDFLKNHPDLVQRFKQVQQRSLAFIKDHPEEAYAAAARDLGISAAEVKSMISWYDFNPQISTGDVQDLKATQDFLFENGLLAQKVNIEDMIIKI